MQVELNRSDYLYYTIKKLLALYVYGLFIMMGFRTFFYFYFAEEGLWQNYSSDILRAFYMGFRYDSMVLSYLLLLPFMLLVTAITLRVKKLINFTQFLSGIWSYLVLFLIVAVLICDVGFYSYFQDHINILFFGLVEDDTEAVFQSIWKNYPAGWGLLGLFTFAFVHFWIIRRIFKFFNNNRSIFNPGSVKFIFGVALVLVTLAIANRGGVSEFVLAPSYAEFSKSQFINGLSLNGVFTLERAIRIRNERTKEDFNMANFYGYKGNIHQAFNDYLELDTTPTKKEHLISLLERKTISNPLLENERPHVVVLVMESFGSYWMRYNSDEFNFLGPLKQFFDQGLYFENFISSDNGTIGSLMVVASNIPNRPGTRFLSESKYMQLPLKSAAHVPYKTRGYETNFIYGGKLGWRDIGKYFSIQGYHNVEGESHIRNNLNLKGTIGTEWGAYDGFMFDHIYKKLDQAKRPQFILALSTSNHPPFEWPKDYQPIPLNVPEQLEKKIVREKDLFHKRFIAFQYANFMLGKFLEQISNSALKNNTVVAVTGDHNFWGFMNYADDELFEKFKVPFYIFIPEHLKPASVDLNKFGSHEDIMPTLYNLTLSKTDYLAFGRDLFGQNESFALNPNVYAGINGVIDRDGKFYPWKDKIGGKIDTDKPTNNYQGLEVYFKSVLSIADFFLRQELENSKKVASEISTQTLE